MTSITPRRTGADKPHKPVSELQEQLEGNLSYGQAPAHGETGSPSANGTLAHMRGAFVRQRFTALNTVVGFQHNLGVTLNPQAVEGRTNVLWHIFYLEHDGTGATGASTVAVLHTRGDAMTEDLIELRCFSAAAGTRTVDADHPVHVVMFFMPAE